MTRTAHDGRQSAMRAGAGHGSGKKRETRETLRKGEGKALNPKSSETRSCQRPGMPDAGTGRQTEVGCGRRFDVEGRMPVSHIKLCERNGQRSDQAQTRHPSRPWDGQHGPHWSDD